MSAMRAFTKYIKNCLERLIAIGKRRNLQDVAGACNVNHLDLENIDEDPEKSNLVHSNTFKNMDARCQKCSNLGHQAMYCPSSSCIYCKLSIKKSAECYKFSTEMKMNIICKQYKLSGHTLDICPKRTNMEYHCQFCQASNLHIELLATR